MSLNGSDCLCWYGGLKVGSGIEVYGCYLEVLQESWLRRGYVTAGSAEGGNPSLPIK